MEERIEIPENVKINIDDVLVSVKKGDKEITRELFYPKVEIKVEGNEVVLSSKQESKKFKRMIKTFASHIQNMIKGVTQDFVYKLKICFHHFPITVEVQGKQVIIKNFLGERKPRKTSIFGNAQVKVDGNIITVTSYNKEHAGQTAANIEKATKRSSYDRRVFQDGIYMIEKDGKPV